jgi:hypothetical protein
VAKEKFQTYSADFPEDLVNNLIKQYPHFDFNSLTTKELSLVYEDTEVLENCQTPFEMLLILHNANLENVYWNFVNLFALW